VNEARAWLHKDGLLLVMEGCQRGSENYARHLIRSWLSDLLQDAITLANIVDAVGRSGVKGTDYEQLIKQHIATARVSETGQRSLPLKPNAVGGKGGAS
jgi:hypothetical protein